MALIRRIFFYFCSAPRLIHKRYAQLLSRTMRFCFTIAVSSIIVGTLSCRHRDPWEKLVIDFDEVDSIVVVSDPYRSPKTIRLTGFQVKTIVDKWNDAPNVGGWKYSPTFEMTVYLDSRESRHFRINSEHIKEDSDECYDLGDKRYFEKLLNTK